MGRSCAYRATGSRRVQIKCRWYRRSPLAWGNRVPPSLHPRVIGDRQRTWCTRQAERSPELPPEAIPPTRTDPQTAVAYVKDACLGPGRADRLHHDLLMWPCSRVQRPGKRARSDDRVPSVSPAWSARKMLARLLFHGLSNTQRAHGVLCRLSILGRSVKQHRGTTENEATQSGGQTHL
jgi:hypothetical protein